MAGGTNSKIKKSNKQIEKQYQYDKEFRDYQNKENNARYDKAVLDRDLQQANYDAQADYKDAIKIKDYNQQQNLQQRQFDLDTEVYDQSLKDYDAQTELNSLSGALALETAQRAKEEALISKTFDLDDQRYDYNEASKNIGYDEDLVQNTRKFAKDTDRINQNEVADNKGFARQTNRINQSELLANKGFARQTNRINQKEIEDKKGFARKDNRINQKEITDKRAFATVDDSVNQGEIEDKKAFALDNTLIDRQDIVEEATFTRAAYKQEDNKLNYTNDKLDNDITFLEDKSGWDVEAAKRTYEKAQVPNFNQRIEALIKREQAEGTARSFGREGLSAEREARSAIAEYGRSQAKLVDDLVFSRKDKDDAQKSIEGTKTYQTNLKNKDKDITSADKEIAKLTKNRKIEKLSLNSSKLTKALQQSLSELDYSSRRSSIQKNQKLNALNYSSQRSSTQKDKELNTLKYSAKRSEAAKDKAFSEIKFAKKRSTAQKDKTISDLKYSAKRSTLKKDKSVEDSRINLSQLGTKQRFLDKRNTLNKSKIKTTYDSAKAQLEADKDRISMDEYSANLAAQGRIPARPKQPVPLPKPFATPRTQLAMPFAPSKPPKPVKGALGKTSVWNDVGDVANVGLQVAGLFL